MKKLGARNYAILSRGVKTLGTYDPNEIAHIIIEDLRIDQADTILNFLKWCHSNNKGFGSANYEKRFSEFLDAQRVSALNIAI